MTGMKAIPIYYGLFYSESIFENSLTLISAHPTKYLAYRARQEFMFNLWVERRDEKPTNLHLSRGFWRSFRSKDPTIGTKIEIRMVNKHGFRIAINE